MITYAVENHVSPELIETLWNVNRRKSWGRREKCQGINRNIVECKLHSRYVSLHGSI